MPPKNRPSSKNSRGKGSDDAEEDEQKKANMFVAANRDAESDDEALPQEESFAMKISLKHIWLTRSDQLEEDDFKTWAHVQIATLDESSVDCAEDIDRALRDEELASPTSQPVFRRNNRLWYAFGDNSQLSKTSVTNGMEAAYNYVRGSKRVRLAPELVEDLRKSRVEVVVYKGSGRHSEKDEPIATLTCSLEAISKGETIKGKFQLRPITKDESGSIKILNASSEKDVSPSANGQSSDEQKEPSAVYGGSVTIEIRPDSSIQNYACGGRFVDLQGVRLNGVPPQWRFPQPSSYTEEILQEAIVPDEDEGSLELVKTLDNRMKEPDSHISLTCEDVGDSFVIPVRANEETDLPGEEMNFTNDEARETIEKCRNNEGNSFRYYLQLLIPSRGEVGTEDILPAVNLPGDVEEKSRIDKHICSTLTNGFLTLERTSQRTGDEDSSSDLYAWQIAWPTHKRFLPASVVKQLRNLANNGWPLLFVVHRVYTEFIEPENRWVSSPPADGDFGRLLHELMSEDGPSTSSSIMSGGVLKLQELTTFVDPLVGAVNQRILSDDWLGRGYGHLPVNSLAQQVEAKVETSIKPLCLSQTLLKLESYNKQCWEQLWEDYLQTLAGHLSTVEEKLSQLGTDKSAKGGKAKQKAGKEKKQGKAKSKGKEKEKKKGKKEEEKSTSPREREVPFYTLMNSIVRWMMLLDRPLQEVKPMPPPPELTPTDIIEPRKTPPEGPLAAAPSEAFRKDVLLSINAIAEQYCSALRSVIDKEGDLGTREGRRKEVLRLMNTTGLYHSMKERLKQSISRIVRERYGATLGLDENDERGDFERMSNSKRDNFVSSLYTYLIGQTYRMLNISREIAEEDHSVEHDKLEFTDPASGEPGDLVESFKESAREIASHVTDASSQLIGEEAQDDMNIKDVPRDGCVNEGVPQDTLYEYWNRFRIARDKEIWEEWTRVEKELKARIAITEKAAMNGRTNGIYSAHAWEDYGEFCARRFKMNHAADAFQEAVSIDSTRISALLLLGAIELERNNRRNAQVFLKAARRITSEEKQPMHQSSMQSAKERNISDVDVIALTLESLLSKDGHEAAVLLREAVSKKYGIAYEETGVEEFETAVLRVYLIVSNFCSRLCCSRLQEVCLTHSDEIAKDIHIDLDLRCELLLARSNLLLTTLSMQRDQNADTGTSEFQDKFKQLQNLLNKAVELNAANLVAWRYLGRSYLLVNDFETALEHFSRSIGNWEDTFRSIHLLGFSEMDQHLPELDFSQLDILKTVYSIARLHQGHGGESEILDAKKIYLRIAKATKFGSAWWGAGETSLLLGHRFHSEAALDESMRMDSSDPVTWATLCRFWLQSSPPQVEEAAQCIDKCLNLHIFPGYVRHHDALRSAVKEYMDQGRFQMAKSICETVLRNGKSEMFSILLEECRNRSGN